MPGPKTPIALLVAALILLVPAAAAPAAAPAPRSGVWPLVPRPVVVTMFDPPEVPWGPGHRGVDLLGRVGQQVHSSLPGTVSFAGSVAGRAVVTVDHGDVRTTYQPVVATVAQGAAVDAGDPIGTLTWRGSHCLPRTCLHWGLVQGVRTYLDPLTLVGCGRRPVRLLPLDAPPPVSGCATPVASARPTGARATARAVLGTALMLAGAPVGRPLGAGPG